MRVFFFTRLLLAAYFLQAGLVLIAFPWMSDWDRNFFVERLAAVSPWLRSPVVRGAVSGIGIVTALAGLAELAAAFGRGPARGEAVTDGPMRSDS